MKRLAILGASGHGKVVADTARQLGWSRVVFFDDAYSGSSEFCGVPVAGGTGTLMESVDQFAEVSVAIGANRVRLRKIRGISDLGARLAILIHPRAYVAPGVRVGSGSVVCAGAVVQPGSVIGEGVIVNTGATVDHDCVLADGVHICPGSHLAGGVSVGECAWVGVGSAVRQYVSIGADAVVGAGAAVVRDVAAGVTVVGVPARPLAGRA